MNALQVELLQHLDNPEQPKRRIYGLRDDAAAAWGAKHRLERLVVGRSLEACVTLPLRADHECGDGCLLLKATLSDHREVWRSLDDPTRCTLVMQPYGPNAEHEDVFARALAASRVVCEANGLCLRYWAADDPENPGWHWPGKTAFVQIERWADA